ncbi:MAG TPA: Cache 3/Cache 2 fusion domain-containing protein [Blastococcus sp.]|nr:Cache 3/Cache 2 fusion domain-containing protein [Blastococcus sp.]
MSRQAAESLSGLRAAIGEISSSANQVSAVTDAAARDAEAIDGRIAVLQTASDAISGMVRLISGISQQSRFLALNAYVEAARAGEVGRGFAVVADEVKALAAKTAQAAEDIAGQIGSVQAETRQAVEAVRRISGTLGSIAEAQETIAAAVEEQRVVTDQVVESVERASAGSTRITASVAELADSQRRIYVRRALAVAEDMLADAGGAELGTAVHTLTVRNQATDAVSTVRVPELLLGGTVLEMVSDPHRPARLVDDVVARVGGSCTLFQKLDDSASMVRVATTVVTPAGKRNVGTYIARIEPDGTPNKVLAEILAGRTYTGAATVAGRPFFTAYAPVRSGAGELIGVLYVGLPTEELSPTGDRPVRP